MASNKSYIGLSLLQLRCLAGCCLPPDEQYLAVERFLRIQDELTDDHFAGVFYRCWKLISVYFPLLEGIPPLDSLKEMAGSARDISLPDRVELAEKFEELFDEEITPLMFSMSLLRLKEEYRFVKYNRVLDESKTILNGRSGSLQGYDDSRVYLQDALSDLLEDPALSSANLGGDINTTEDAQDVLRQYMDAKNGGMRGVKTGFRDFDSIIGGLFPGDIMLVAGYTSEGKSKVSMNIAYNVCYEQGGNVLFATSESTRDAVRRGFIVRHSYHNDRFVGMNPLRYNAVKFGTLSPDGEAALKQVVADMRMAEDSEGNRRHGIMDVCFFPSNSTANYIAELVRSRQRQWDSVDLVVVDYLGLMSSASKRTTRREELDDVLVQSKRLAVELNVPILSPWQVSRSAWVQAQEAKQYTKAALSDTSQAEKTSDVVLSILQMDEPNKLKCQILKARDGEVGAEFELHTDFASNYVSAGLDPMGGIFDR